MELDPFIRLIKDKCGLSIDAQSPILPNAIRTRMAKAGIGCHNQYFDSLLCNHEELSSLVDLLTVNETYFFREPRHYALFTDQLIPELLDKKKGGGKIKILSAGCATGEEPYTMAIALIEKYGPEILNSVSIIGVDIDRQAIAKARQGIYNKHSFRGVPASIMEKYFTPAAGDLYELIPSVKSSLQLYDLNLLTDFYPAELKEIDIIFYRNVSIYFDTDCLKRIFKKLSGLLNENGYVLLGSSETLSHNLGILFLIQMEGIFLYHKKVELSIADRRNRAPRPRRPYAPVKRRSGSREKSAGKSLVKSASSHAHEPRPRDPARSLLDQALASAKNKDYEDALSHINQLTSQEPDFIKATNVKACILINLQRLDEAARICLNNLRFDEWNLECHLLLGLIAKIQNREEEASKRFKGALYIQPSCWLAHLYLGDIYNAQGEHDAAHQKYSMAIKLLKKHGMKNNGLTFFPFSFPVEQLIHMCEHNIKRLQTLKV